MLFDRLWQGAAFAGNKGDETTEVTGSVPLLTGSDAVVEHYPSRGVIVRQPKKDERLDLMNVTAMRIDRLRRSVAITGIGNLKAQVPEES